jgi:hypothetical protein
MSQVCRKPDGPREQDVQTIAETGDCMFIQQIV